MKGSARRYAEPKATPTSGDRGARPEAGHAGHSTARTRNQEVLYVVLAALLARLTFGLLTSNTYDYDEFVLLLLARDWAHGAAPYSGFMFFHPPGALVLLRSIEGLTSMWWPVARILSGLLDAGTAGLVFLLARRLYSLPGAYAAATLYALSPLALVSATRVGQDPLLTFLATAGLACLVLRRGPVAAAVAGLLLAAAIWTKYPAAIFLPVYVLADLRRSPWVLAGLAGGLILLFLPFLPHLGDLYRQTVTFQRGRWLMNPFQRAATVGLYWLLVNPLAVAGLWRPKCAWAAAGFILGGVFILASQVYYHYYVPIVPFAALLGAPVAVRLLSRPVRTLVVLGSAAALAFALLLDLGGTSPLYVTAASLSALTPTIHALDRDTAPEDGVLADQYEYAYLARRPVAFHYFWNMGVLINAAQLEGRLPERGSVVLSYGASSGFPPGFVGDLDDHYRSIQTATTTVWILTEKK